MFHVIPDTGEVRRCRATKKRCPYRQMDSAHAVESSQAERISSLRMAAENWPLGKLPQFSLEQDGNLFPMLTRGRVAKPDYNDVQAFLDMNPHRNLICPECGKQAGDAWDAIYMQSYGYETICQSCGVILLQPLVEPDLDSPTYMALEQANVPRMLWYHATIMDDWHEAILRGALGPAHVHVGGEMAALDRGVSIYHGGACHLYVVEVLPDATVDGEVLPDGEENFEPTGDEDVTRYVNRFEDVGSISLAVNPKKLRILGRLTGAHEELSSPLSTYHWSNALEVDMDKRLRGRKKSLGIPLDQWELTEEEGT